MPPTGTVEDLRRHEAAAASDRNKPGNGGPGPEDPPEPDVPGEGEGEQAPEDEVVQLSIEGDADVRMGTLGGRTADQSFLTIVGGEITVAGAMKKGDRVRIVLEGPITEVAFTDVRDPKTKQVAATKRKHKMTPDFIQREKVSAD